MLLDNLQVFYREATAVRTEVVAYLADLEDDTSDMCLRGYVKGPLATHAKTLPLRVPFEVHRASGDALMSAAELTETCFWEPGSPHWYEATVSLCRGDDVIDEVRRTVGVRPMSVTDEGLRMNGRPYVLRAVRVDDVTDESQAACLEEKLALAIDTTSDVHLATASEAGLPLITRVAGSAADVVAQLRHLSRWPAVVLAIVESPEELTESLRVECPNMLLAEPAVKSQPPTEWAHLAIVDDSSDIVVSHLALSAIRRLRARANDSLSQRIETAARFEPDEHTAHGKVVGCIV